MDYENIEENEIAVEEDRHEINLTSVYSNAFAQAAELADNMAESIRFMLNDLTSDAIEYFEEGALQCKENGEAGQRHYKVLNQTLKRESGKLAADETCTHIVAPLSLKMMQGVPKIQEAKKHAPKETAETAETTGETAETTQDEPTVKNIFKEICDTFASSASDKEIRAAIKILADIKKYEYYADNFYKR